MRKEIFKTGRHTDSKGITRNFTLSHLSRILKNFSNESERNSLGHHVPGTKGHPKTDGAPALAWVKSLELVGEKLFANFRFVNDKVKQAVKDKILRNVSVGLHGANYDILHHVALTNFEAVPNLDDFEFATFSDKNKTPCETFTAAEQEPDDKTETLLSRFTDKIINHFKPQGENNMSETQTPEVQVPEGLEAKFSSLQERITALETEKKTVEANFSAIKAENESLKKTIAEDREKALDEKDANFVDSGISNGQIAPYERQNHLSMLKTLRGLPKANFSYVNAETQKSEVKELTPAENYKVQLSARPKLSEYSDLGAKDGVSRHDNDMDSIDIRTEEIHKEKGINYSEAYALAVQEVK